MTHRLSLALIVLACLVCSTAAFAQRGNRLAVGDAAPGLSIDKWVKGDETGLDQGTTYIVEFWATWCAPCKKSIPHLTKLQQMYDLEDLRIIGVSGEEPDVVSKFVKKMGRRMDYTVVVDKRGGTNRAWMKAAGKNGIPTAFIVGPKGRVQFIGHPMDPEFEEILEQVMSGRYNKKLMDQARSHLTAIDNARRLKNWDQYERLTKEVIDRDPRIFYFLVLQRYNVFMLEQQDAAKANAYASEAIMSYPDDPELLSWLGEEIINNPKIPDAKRNSDIALLAVQAARINGRPNDPRFIESEAMVRYYRGEIDQAVTLQEKAYFSATPRKKDLYRPKLEEYRKKKDELAAAAAGTSNDD